jgi:hypothetical protein
MRPPRHARVPDVSGPVGGPLVLAAAKRKASFCEQKEAKKLF